LFIPRFARRACTASIIALAASTLGVPGATAEMDHRPNVVLILADDLDALTTPVWQAMPFTAELIRDRGMEFANGFAPLPICCGGRSSMLTGEYGHNTGVVTNDGPAGGFRAFRAKGNESRTFVKALHDGGYRTGMAGIYLHGLEHSPGHIPPGWDDWHAGAETSLYTGYNYTLNENGRAVEYGEAPEDYLTDVVAEKSRRFITDSAASGQPFFWYAASTAPHAPLPPAPRHLAETEPAGVPKSPNYLETDVSDKPGWLTRSADARTEALEATNDADYTDRLGALKALDEMVADIVRTLTDTGELDKTYLIFTSDNGYNLGAHRLNEKMAPYEESLRVPLAIAGPGIDSRCTAAMALSIDLAPTILEWAGLVPPDRMDGRSLVPVLNGETTPWRTDFLAEYGGAGYTGRDGVAQEQVLAAETTADVLDIPSWIAVRDERWLYVRWYERERPIEDREHELYDLRNDPYQLSNLLDSPESRAAHADVVAGLDRRLSELRTCSGASCR